MEGGSTCDRERGEVVGESVRGQGKRAGIKGE